MDIKFSYANCKQNAKNKLYPNTAIVKDIIELPKFMKYDYTFIEFKDGLRKKENFVEALSILLRQMLNYLMRLVSNLN